MKVENVIFDLGGVILNIDYNKTINAFKALGDQSFDSLFTQANQTDLFDKYEKGLCSSQYFINGLLDYLPAGTTANAAVNAWNAMLLELPQKRIEKLFLLKEKYRTFLLSNTNDIHLDAFHSIIKKENQLNSLSPLFEKVYFSCEMKMRKPDTEIFLSVCDQNNLVPENTLFIDDSIQHVEGAKKAGLQAYHLTNGETILDLKFL